MTVFCLVTILLIGVILNDGFGICPKFRGSDLSITLQSQLSFFFYCVLLY